jgi:hypothetical protein
MKLESSQQIFEERSNIKFYENASSGGRNVPRGQKDGHDEDNGRFRNFAKATKNVFNNRKYKQYTG